jgi:serine/threonine-protein phosphatase 6 regulatory ankyrin repeat subunit B
LRDVIDNNPGLSELSFYAFSWIVAADRALDKRELGTAVAISQLATNLSKDGIEIRQATNQTTMWPGFNVHFAHFLRFDGPRVSIIHKSVTTALHEFYASLGNGLLSHEALATLCVRYLICSLPTENEDLTLIDSAGQLLHYAASCWHRHYHLSYPEDRMELDDLEDNQPDLQKLTLELLTSSDLRQRWYAFCLNPKSSGAPPTAPVALELAAGFGFHHLVRILLKDKADEQSLEKALMRAAIGAQAEPRAGHAQAADLLLREGARTGAALQLFARNDDVHMVNRLLAVEGENEAGSAAIEQALKVAAKHGALHVIETFASIPKVDIMQNLPLEEAANGGHTLTVFYLHYLSRCPSQPHSAELLEILERKAAVALLGAINRGNDDIVRLLVQNGTKVQVGHLDLAAISGNMEVFRSLLEALKSQNAVSLLQECEALAHACGNGHLDLVRLLLDLEVPIDKAYENEDTAMHRAARQGSPEIVNCLLSRGAGVHLTNDTDRTAAHEAAMFGHLSAYQALQSSPDVREDDRVVTCAAERGQLHMVKYLLRLKVMVAGEPGSLVRAMLEAASGGYVEILDELCRAGLEPYCRTDQRLLFAADGGGHGGVIEYLLSKGANIESRNYMDRTPLHILVEFPAIVKMLLGKGANIHARDNAASTPLHHAAVGRQQFSEDPCESVKLLLEAGANPNARDDDGDTPLHWAADNGFQRGAIMLLDKGANPVATNLARRTPLHLAAGRDHKDAIRVLLEKTTENIDWTDFEGKTALHHAVVSGKTDALAAILGAGAKVDIGCVSKDTPLSIAASIGKSEAVRLLLDYGARLESVNDQGWTPLLYAAAQGHLETVKILLDRGAKIEATCRFGWTPLNLASSNEHSDLVRLLLDRSANIETQMAEGWTPLATAAATGCLEIARMLIERGAEIETETSLGWTPLGLAANIGNSDIVQLLLESGARIDARNHQGWTALACASAEGRLETVRLLLDRGAEVNSVTDLGWTPLAVAGNNGHLEITQLLLERGGDVKRATKDGSTPLATAAVVGHVDVMRVLLDAGADIDAVNESEMTALYTAARAGHVEAVRLLLDRGAQLIVDAIGWTPLHAAAGSGQLEVAKLLIERGSDISVADANEATPLFAAVDDGHVEVARYLLEKGASMSQRNISQETVLHRAANYGHVEVIELLASKGCDINALDECNRVPLHLAIQFLQIEATAVILSRGSSTSTYDIFGRTPLDWLCLHNREPFYDRFSPLRIAAAYPTPYIEQRRRVVNSVHRIAHKMEQGDCSDRFPLNLLSGCLSRLNDHQLATLCLVAEADYDPKKGKWQFPGACDLCDGDIYTVRYRCKNCVETDLCSECMPKHQAGSGIRWCTKEHEYLEARKDDPAPEGPEEEVEKRRIADLRKLLKSIRFRYGLDIG